MSHENQSPQAPWWSWETVRVILGALLVALCLRLWIAEPRYIPSDSMVPTLETGDRILVEKISYRIHPPRRGDIVVFYPPFAKPNQAFIKRVVGLPGELLAIHDGQVFINGVPYREPYIAAAIDYEMPSLQIPPGAYWVMGDNRNNSNDSHVWGFLPAQNIIGHAVFRFFPWGNHFGKIR
ncbi:MAG: signal peptidase I [Oscillatoriales cyanobacterium SM2_2_1]|nr:signal peptidase I [Oscillatoriales cyanobacterium SM2_2_1]